MGSRLTAAKRRYDQAIETTERLREDLYGVIRAEYDGGKGKTLRAIAAETGLTYGRVGQIVRGE